MSRLILGVATRGRRGLRPVTRMGHFEDYESRVLASQNDAHEILASGVVSVTDEVLRLGTNQESQPLIAGMRWTSVTLSQDASVPLARVFFSTWSSGNTHPVLVRFWAHASDHSPAFLTDPYDLSSRAKTTAFVDWDVPSWPSDSAGDHTTTPDLSALVQEVVNRPGWAFGNALTILAELTPGQTLSDFPRRRAWAFDGNADLAARLTINTTSESEPPPPSGGGDFGDGFDLYGLAGNDSFSAASPTLKDGTSITGDMRYYFDACVAWINHPTPHSQADLSQSMARSNIHTNARYSQGCLDALMRVFRLTGDRRFLDKMCDGLNACSSSAMRVSWNGHDCTALAGRSEADCCDGSGNPWSPYDKVLYYSEGRWTHGTDLETMNACKMWAIIAEITWALHLNRGKTSPGGHNYTALADAWGARMEQLVDAWSGARDVCWRDKNYHGVDGMSGSGIPNTGSSKRKQEWGKYPILVRNEAHAGPNAIALHHFIGRLGQTGLWNIPNPGAALQAAHDMTVAMRNNSMYACSTPLGPSLIFPHNKPFNAIQDGQTSVQRTTYTGYNAGTNVQLWMLGGYRQVFTREDMLRLARQWSYATHADGGMWRTLLGDQASACGLSGDVIANSESPAWQSIRGSAAMCIFIPFGESSHLWNAAINAQNSNGGFVNPDRGLLPSALFTKLALESVGDFD